MKKLNMTARPVSPAQPPTADDWVTGTGKPAPSAPQGGPTKRLTIDLPEDSHTRFKVACARHKTKMVEEVTAFIERRTAEMEGQGTAS